ncbi:polysaccharide biosynthesis/export family protein [Methylobacterium persicinum]|uniref:Polysaccharide export outer membrane protein n=1 Tax=Methylobacterium persicinum TaxID=374426 RepID=A0ABU0HQC0_9HYPH|nr:polysaccharide biosynthesis/export family protein [Methylobacterium persicinum]MDQ0443696.1 polysaccharide export outer membrane protein [Methylobacterium persicinum]GJE40177.1 hypothetical protein KHHGKMAE_4267 [Methylobacterium persicinum]
MIRALPFLLAAVALCAAGPARATYRLGPGDVVEVSVLGVQDYRRRVTVDVDGAVALPLVGEIPAEGLAVGDLRRRITEGLVAGRALKNPDVTVELVEYRPFYVSGDVARPGAIPYRPGLTARVAVALAGGYDALRFRSENPLLLAPEIRGQYEAAWVELLRRQARFLTLTAEADGKDTADLSSLSAAPLQPGTVAALAASEARDLKARVADFARQKLFQERALDRLKANVADLETSAQQQEVIVGRQREAVERSSLSFAKGVSPVMRAEEENRALAALSSQFQETTARLVAARKERDEAARGVERLVEERRQRLLREGQDALVDVERLRSQVKASGERLLYAGAVKAQVQRGGRGPDLVVHRRVEGAMQAIAVAEDGELLPGDVLDVAIRPDLSVFAPGQ